MAFDAYWSNNYYTFANNNTIAIFNQPSTDVFAERADYHQYPCAKLAPVFRGPFRVAITFSGVASWFGLGIPTAVPNGFEPYKSRAWMASTELEYFLLNKPAICTWITFFNKEINIKNYRLAFNAGYLSNQMLIVTVHPQDKWMLVTANTLQVRFELQDLPPDSFNAGYYFMVSLGYGRAEVHSVTDPISVPPALLTSSQWSCPRHMVSKHHFFISYRVASEAALAHKLFGLIELKRPGTVAFLDANCLPHAIDWRASFEFGLKHSRVIVLLISESSLERIKANAPNFPDNVLLEFELAIIRKRTEPEGTLAVFPVFVGTNPTININGADKTAYVDCALPYGSSFPAVEHARGFHLPGAPSTIRETIEQVLQLNGVFVNSKDNKLFELLYMLFNTLEKVNAARKEFLLDPCALG